MIRTRTARKQLQSQTATQTGTGGKEPRDRHRRQPLLPADPGSHLDEEHLRQIPRRSRCPDRTAGRPVTDAQPRARGPAAWLGVPALRAQDCDDNGLLRKENLWFGHHHNYNRYCSSERPRRPLNFAPGSNLTLLEPNLALLPIAMPGGYNRRFTEKTANDPHGSR